MVNSNNSQKTLAVEMCDIEDLPWFCLLRMC